MMKMSGANTYTETLGRTDPTVEMGREEVGASVSEQEIKEKKWAIKR